MVSFLFITNNCFSSEKVELKWSDRYCDIGNENSFIKIGDLPVEIIDSLAKYLNYFDLDNKLYYYKLDKYFICMKTVKDKFVNNYNPKDKSVLILFDTLSKIFKIYLNTLAKYNYPLFFEKNNSLYVFRQKSISDKKRYRCLFKINANEIDSCYGYIFKNQDVTGLSAYSEIMYEEDGSIKIPISSYKQKFQYIWLLLFWAPRSAPKKWLIDYSSEKIYIYTLDKNLKLKSIEKVLNKDD